MRGPRFRRLLSLALGRRSIERDVDDEMRFHIAMRVDDLMRDGIDRVDAERRAMREYGDLVAARAELAAIDRRRVRSESRREWFGSLGQDIWFGLRGLRSRPAFTITILLTLALGIGANAAIFRFVDAALLRPLPFARPDRLVHLWETFESKVDQRSEASFPDYLVWRARNVVFSDLGGYQDADFIVGGERPTTVAGMKVTANFFDVLGLRSLVGRTFVENEDAPGAPKIALLAYGFWQRQFGADRSVIGRTVTINGASATIIGVLPESFRFSMIDEPQVIMPIDRSAETRATRDNHWLQIVARLREGVDARAATSNISAIMGDLAKQYPEYNAGRDAIAIPLQDQMVGSVRPILLLVYGAVVVVLLIACVNVANLLLIRGADRDRELTVRAALGAGRSRLVRQLLTEGLLLAVCGGALGLLVAWLGVHALLRTLPPRPLQGFAALTAPSLDARVIGYTMLISIVAGLGFGVVPAFRATRPRLGAALRVSGRGTIGGGAHLRDGLVSAEVALTVLLLSGAMLFGKSLLRLLSVDPGFQPQRVVTTSVALPSTRYSSKISQADFYRRFEEGVRQLPGIQSVGLVTKLPLDYGASLGFDVVGRRSRAGETPATSYRLASRDYFHTMRIPILRGRVFEMSDDAHLPSAGVITRTFAEVYFPGEDPVGQRLYLARDTVRIVGIVGDVPIGSIGDRIPPTLYLALNQFPSTSMAVAIRTSATTAEIGRALRGVVSAIDASVALTPPVSMDDLIDQSPSVFMRRFPMFVVGAFALTALLLAIIGIYGVVSYAVAQRTREMGIRIALGARTTSVLGLVMRHGLTTSAIGIVVGLVATRLLGRFTSSLLFGVQPGDPITYISVAGVLASVAVVATILPARRATRIDPALALRSD
jgi:putative ABC transport system permease protein